MGFTVPAGSTSAVLSVQWPQTSGTQTVWVTLPGSTSMAIPDYNLQLGVNNLELLSGLSSSVERKVLAVGSATDPTIALPAGTYTLAVVSTEPIDPSKIVWSSSFQLTPPVLDNPLVDVPDQ